MEALQKLAIFEILQETIKLIFTWKKIFTQITLSFILPQSLLLFTYLQISPTIPSHKTHYSLLFYFSLFTAPIFLSLLSSAAATYAVDCIYAERDVTFRQVTAIIPKVWKRLLITLLCVNFSLLAINFLFFLLIGLLAGLFIFAGIYGSSGDFSLAPTTVMILVVFSSVCLIITTTYVTVKWQLSIPVSVLEEVSGFKAMAESKALVKGKMAVAGVTAVVLGLFAVLGQILYLFLVVRSEIGVVMKGVLGISCVCLFSLCILMKLVSDTVLYFACKSEHSEKDDMSDLKGYFRDYALSDYGPLKVNEVPVGKLEV